MKLLLSALLLTGGLLHADNKNLQHIGDTLQILIPAAAYGTTLWLDDDEGEMQFYKSFAANLAATYALKYTVKEKRPDSGATDSFPSGHTSSSFQGATFIHMRYGLKYAVVPYLGAMLTGYSRVNTHRHHWNDVVAGAMLGSLSSWYFTERYPDVTVTPVLTEEHAGVSVTYRF